MSEIKIQISKEKLLIDEDISRLVVQLRNIQFKLDSLRASRIQLDKNPERYFEIKKEIKKSFF